MEIVVIGTVKIQPYIFGSNRLRENIGASYLVNEATHTWVLANLPEPHNVNIETGELDDNKWIERDNLKAEAIYMGGGNAVLLFREACDVDPFIHRYTRHVLANAPGLQVIMAQHTFDWDECDRKKTLADEVQAAFFKLGRVRHSYARSAPLLGLGVTAVCQSTGLPAVAIAPAISQDDLSRYPISAVIQAKLDVIQPLEGPNGQLKLNKADKRLRDYLPNEHSYAYPRDFDNMGRSEGEHSYIAIVHADGDGIGDINLQVGKGQDNRAYIQAQRDFSRQLDKIGKEALGDTVEVLVRNIKEGVIEYGERKIELQRGERGDYYLPFRPIVFGGDDVTFVCDGRLGISLALSFMEAFARRAKDLGGNKKPITASAGIVIVKSHYPFARAYDLVTELTHSAKDYRKAQPPGHGGCLDWHFATGGLLGSLDEIRARECRVPHGRLTLRPVSRHYQEAKYEGYRSWALIQQGIDLFTGEAWLNRHNKAQDLRVALRHGPDAVIDFRRMYLAGKSVTAPMDEVDGRQAGWEHFQETGWHEAYCGYYDALELADWFIPIGTELSQEGA